MASQLATALVSVAVNDTQKIVTVPKPVGFLICEWVILHTTKFPPAITCEIMIGAGPVRKLLDKADWGVGRDALSRIGELLSSTEDGVRLTFDFSSAVTVPHEISITAKFRS